MITVWLATFVIVKLGLITLIVIVAISHLPEGEVFIQIWYSIWYTPTGVPGTTVTSPVVVFNTTPGLDAGLISVIVTSVGTTERPLKMSLTNISGIAEPPIEVKPVLEKTVPISSTANGNKFGVVIGLVNVPPAMPNCAEKYRSVFSPDIPIKKVILLLGFS